MGQENAGVSGTVKPYESEIDNAIQCMNGAVIGAVSRVGTAASDEVQRMDASARDNVSRANASAERASDAARLFEDGVIILTGDEIHDMFVSVEED